MGKGIEEVVHILLEMIRSNNAKKNDELQQIHKFVVKNTGPLNITNGFVRYQRPDSTDEPLIPHSRVPLMCRQNQRVPSPGSDPN